MSASWSRIEALRNDPTFLAEVEARFREEDEQRAEREAIRREGAGSMRGEAPHLTCTRRITPYSPAADSVALGIYLDAIRKARLKQKYGWGAGLPKFEPKDVPVEQRAEADALREIRLDKRADRRMICDLVGELWQCPCAKTWKTRWGCQLRSCPTCAPKIFNRAFSQLVSLDDYIPASLRSLPGWGWKILDFTFRHDGEFAPTDTLRKMRQVVNRTTDRAVRGQCSKMYQAAFYSKRELREGKPYSVQTLCPVRFEEIQTASETVKRPMMSAAGWPLVSASDGSVRELVGWDVVHVGGLQKRPTCVRCGSCVKQEKVKRVRICEWLGSEGVPEVRRRVCPNCGPVEWPDWENQEIDTGRWRLRFGTLHIPVSEFGFDGTNYHFHGAYFGPYLPNDATCRKCKSQVKRSCRTCGSLVKRNEQAKRGWKCPKCGPVDRNDRAKLGWYCMSCGTVDEIVDGRLTQIFKEESKKLLGVESRGVWIEKAKGGFRAALAHALKYTAKPPASSPAGRAAYEKALVGVRRYAVRGLLQGVPIAEEKRDAPRCPECRKTIRKIPGIGIVPLSEIETVPFLRDEPEAQVKPPPEPSAEWFDGSEETFTHTPRAPC